MWGADVPCYVFVSDRDLFIVDRLQGVEILFHLAGLPFLQVLAREDANSSCWHNLKRTYPGIERVKWKQLKSFEGASQGLKEHQLYITAVGLLGMLRKSRVAKAFLANRALTLESAEAELRGLCDGLRQRFRDDPNAWLHPDPRAVDPNLPVAQPILPPLPVAEHKEEDVQLQLADAADGDQDPTMPPRRGRRKRTAAELKAANDQRATLRSANSQLAIARRLLDEYNKTHGGLGLYEALSIRDNHKRKDHPGPSSGALTKKQKIAVFTECVGDLFPPIWTVLLGIDMAFMSFQAAATLRSFAGAKFIQPPREWISDYARLLSAQCETEFDVIPRGSDTHPTLTDRDDGKGRPLTSKDAVSTNLESLLSWHIMGAIAEGHDLRPYLFESPEQKSLQYKITFDTTQTCKQDLFMMGVIPHTFPLSARQTTLKGNVQSASNVLILCLAHIGESTHVIQEAVPGLRTTVQRLTNMGTAIILQGSVEFRFRVEFHVAADLKALWLALGLKNFVCPFCTQTSFNENIRSTFDARELSGCLGVPSNRVHLCSLHASLRIVERLLKNAASFAYQHNEKKVRVRKLKELAKLIETRLKRKRFNIAVGQKEDKAENTLPADEVFLESDRELGENIGPLIKNNIHIKMSALTGAQAVRILQDKQFYEAIVSTTEGTV